MCIFKFCCYLLIYNLNIHTLALQISKDSVQKRKAIITPVNSTTITSSVSSLVVKKELKQCFRQTIARKMEAKKLWEDWPSNV
uniref:Secreted protein n=1 Tax=Glossina palpalis gambiensis TaxID=67801 RepID=A0A1B0BCS0_9MUSC